MAQTNWTEKAFIHPQDRLSVDIHFPQGCRKVVPQGSDAGHDYISPVVFKVQIAYYSTPTNWVNLKDENGITEVPYIVVGADVPMKDGFTKSVTYYAALGQFRNDERFTVRIRRESASASQTYMDAHKEYVYYYTSILQSITGYRNTKPAVDPKNTEIAKTALSVVASKQLTGQIEGINAVVTTWCKIWNGISGNGSNWDTYANTSNPAALFRYVLTHPGNPQRILEEEVAERIDLAKLQYWYTYCENDRTFVEVVDNVSITRHFKFEFNSVLGAQKGVLDVLKDICAAGRGSPALIDGKWSINIDEPKDVVQHFSTHNSWGFESVKALPKIPDGIKIQFFNELKEFQQDELIVWNYGFDETTAELFESITLPGVTNPYMVQDTGKWHFAQLKLRPEVYTINTDIEYLVCNRGDRVKVTHDVPMWGLGSGRIKNRLSASVYEVDEEVYIEAGSSYTIRVRSALGASNTAQVKTSFNVSNYSVSNNVVTLIISNSTNRHPLVVGNTVKVIGSVIASSVALITSVTDSTISYALTSGNTSGTGGTVELTNGYYSTVQLQSDLTLASATYGDLFLYGELNKESQDLIVLSIEPTSGAKNARLTLVDYGVVEGTDGYNIFADYQNLSSVSFESQITNTPKYLIDSIGTNRPEITLTNIISDESVMTLISPGVFRYGIRVPFTTGIDLPVVAEWVEGEITRYYDNSQATASTITVPVLAGSILFNDVVEASKYKFRLRYVTTDGRTGLWTEYANTTVVGKSNPPSTPTNVNATPSESAVSITWDKCPEVDYAYTIVKYNIVNTIPTPMTVTSDWTSGIVLFEGIANRFDWIRPITNTYRILVKHVDTSGIESAQYYYKIVDYTQIELASIRAELSNPTPLIASASDGSNPVLAGSGTEIRLYEGNTLLKYDATSTANGFWHFSKTDSGLASAATPTDSGDYATLGILQSFSDATSGTVTYTITGKTTLGFAISKTVVHKYVKAKAGTPTYTWIAYADNDTGSSNFSTAAGTGASARAYVGIASNKSTVGPGAYTEYTWSKIKGADGDPGLPGLPGLPGNPGADAITYYTWIAYADNATGSSNFSTTAGTRAYIGIATNQTSSTPSTNYALYQWSKIVGSDGNKTTTIYASQWSNSGTPAKIQAATYTWSNGAISAYPSGWAASAGAAPATTGYVLYQIGLVISDVASATSTAFNWSNAVSNSIGYREDGSIGLTGASARTAYVVNTSATVPGAVTAGTGDVVPTSTAGTWSFTSTSTLTAGQYMYQVDGIYNPNPSPGTTTWGNPYLSNLKVGSLSALAVDTGNLTVSTTGSIRNSGNTGYGQAGFFLGYDTTTYKFSIGGSTGLLYDGAILTVPAITISDGAISGIGTGNNTVVANSSITIASGAISGIGTGNNTVVANSSITIASGVLTGIGTAGKVVDNGIITVNANGSLNNAGTGNTTLPGIGQNSFIVGSNGSAATTSLFSAGLYKNGTYISGTYGRSYTLIKIARASGEITFTRTYDVYGAGAVGGYTAATLAADLNATYVDSIVVVIGFDEPQGNRLTSGLDTAMYRCGASRVVYGSVNFKYRASYILVGIGGCGEGNGAEAYQGTTDGDVNAWCAIGFSIVGGMLTGVSNSYVPLTLQDYSYTGALDATKGAPSGTYVGGTLAETVEANALAVTNATTGLNAKLSKSSDSILAATVSIDTAINNAGFVAGNLKWNTAGSRISGSGVALTAGGLVGYNSAGTNTFNIDATTGNATFAGSLSAATGSFAGSLSAATGTFAGSLSAATGTFAGSLSAATGSFAGSLSAATGSFAGSLSAATGSFTGGVYGGAYLPQYGNNWPIDPATSVNTTVGEGFALTSGGLLLGNYTAWAANPGGGRGFFQITHEGVVNSPNFSITRAGNVTVTGAVYATSGTFAGSLSAATGTFAGSLSAATGNFSGAVYGGSYTGYGWPTGSTSGGYYLGTGGLLMGSVYNPNSGYVQIGSNGYVSMGKGGAGGAFTQYFGVSTTGDVTYAGTLNGAIVGNSNIQPNAVTASKIDITNGQAGSKVVITDNLITIYDSNVIRVKLGNLA